jgi:hypothetical protein
VTEESSALPREWIGTNIELTIAGAHADTRGTSRLVAIGSDGIRVEDQEVEVQRFVPWTALRQVRRGKY